MSPLKIKVLIADDSGFMRLVLSDMINSDGELTMVASAENGKEAYEKTKKLRPDVLLLDLIMPEYDGLYAIKSIMRDCPTPIVILSSSGVMDSKRVFEALDAGAFDFLNKPKGTFGSKIRDIEEQVIAKIKSAAYINTDRLSKKSAQLNNHLHTFDKALPYEIVAIGSSTGGTGAIEEILKKLPSNFPIPIVIAQHMPQEFVESFARRLNDLFPFTVKVAEKGEPLQKGSIYLSPGSTNTLLENDPTTGQVCIGFTSHRFTEYNDPSVDCLFTSVAHTYASKALAIVLSGMGKDGTKGMQALHLAGAYTMAQDEQSSIVFGMPKSAIEKGIVKKTLSIYEMGGFLVSCLS
ncbi:chemotaxis-specific protein-glutamate methyltransferase CheB [Rhodocytophaga aerolata]|uniref:Protein-glutamate methylesterase/protein-glutamine glutaminase n=1 Tax=Rhodocytophaga aerolata TaxID=455078 RepID=A0ABT8RGN1_9BACT|nr:chemotaxis-specific protein-glutamate methyltransferase CheB [Rhodocytophaga aerolata]MDO1451263.1 chemotaxis-specific protein-glutamate methyltransferase CheB [Rhodocytophaga aerolata]